jgi:hypothetical protein
MSKAYTIAEPGRAWIDAQVAAGAAVDAEAYLTALIENDRQLAEKRTAWNAAIDEGYASGSCGLTAEEIFDQARHRHRLAVP